MAKRDAIPTLRPFTFVLLMTSVLALTATAQDKPEVSHAVHSDVSPPLSDIPPKVDKAAPHEKFLGRPFPGGIITGGPDTAVQTTVSPLVSVSSPTTFLGVGLGFAGPAGAFTVNSAPPDPNLAVGATQVVQWVNTSFAVFDKSTGSVLLGPAAGNTLWAGFGGVCEASNDGDPIVQYDKTANRWIMTQLQVSLSPFTQCVAVSTTSDATGTWFRYAFQESAFNDYPKLGVWPDAYYLSFNMFGRRRFIGAQACALERSKMLIGDPTATQICFQLSSSVASLLPSDWDGPASPPPAGSPNYYLNFGTNSLNLWKFHVDFTTPANSTFTGATTIPVASFAPACGGGACIPQPNTSQVLDSLGDRLMYRLAYRNFGDHESLVVNHSVNAGSSVGVRWYELRSPGGTPTVFQQSTYAPDAKYRWMGSIAMDKAQNIAVGYSVSSSSMSPSIAFTGRSSTDPLSTLQSETMIVAGSGSQLPNLNRWGDYTSLSVDPVDDCTFWYTNEYLTASGTFNWSTQLAKFSFPSCGTPDFTVSASPASQTVAVGAGTSYTATVTSLGGFTGTVTFSASGVPTGANATFSPTSVASSGSSTMSVTTSSTTPAGTYTLTITGTSGTLMHSTTVTLVVNPPPTPDFTIAASPGSRTVTPGTGTSYIATVTAANGFAGTVTFSASGLPSGATTSFSPPSVTASGSSTTSVTTSGTTPAGTYTLTITGTSGALVHSTTVTLVVSDFTITASPASRTVTVGTGTTYTATVTAVNGFTGTVTFSASGVPTGATVSFSPVSVAASGSSTMSVATSATTPAGTYTLTVTGTSGTLVHSTTVTLVVNAAGAGDFSLSASPSAITTSTGSTVSYTVTVTPSGGFAGTVSLSASGQPSAVTVTFAPSSVAGSGSSTMTVDVGDAGPPGTYTLTITGTSGASQHTTTVSVTITAG